MNPALFSIDDIRNSFDREMAVGEPIDKTNRSAAVAMIFNQINDSLNLCFGLRATYEGDPWSGDMAFPGGKAEPEDQTFHHVAQREAFEEIGFELDENHLVGGLNILQTHGNEKRLPLSLKPMIYILEDAPAPFNISSELQAAYWIPINHLWQPNNWEYKHIKWREHWFPGIQYQEQIIWGLTLRILMQFGESMGCPIEPAPKRIL